MSLLLYPPAATLRLFVTFLLGLLVPAPQSLAAQQDAADRDAILAVLSGYHAAFTAGQPDSVFALLGPSYFMADERTGAGADRASPHLFLSGERLRKWPANSHAAAAPHANTFELLHWSVRGNAAVAVTRDTGSNRVRRWKDEEVTWFLGRMEAGWRIVAMVIRDVQH